MKRLYRAEALVSVYMLAKDEQEAKDGAGECFEEDLTIHGFPSGVEVNVTEVRSADDVETEWRNSRPYDAKEPTGPADTSAGTCENYFARLTAWRKQNAARDPLPGQLTLFEDIPPTPRRSPADPSDLDNHVVVARHLCGCSSMVATVNEHFDRRDWLEFYLEAGRRKCNVQIMPFAEYQKSAGANWRCREHARPKDGSATG